MRKLALLCAVLALVAFAAAPALAQQHPATETDYEAAVDALMAEYNRSDAPGGVLGVVHGGELIFAKAYGMASLEQGTRLTTESILDLGSVAKQMTAFAIVLLEQRGALGFDDPISEHLEDLPAYTEGVTIRQLVHHTSGIRDIYAANEIAGYQTGDGLDQGDGLQLVHKMRELNFPAGTEYLYSNTGYMLLADIVASASGMSFPDFMYQDVFGPLGMENTVIMEQRGQVIPGAAESYEPRRGGGFIRIYDNSGLQGAGGVYSTLADLAKWMTNYRTGEVGGGAAIEQMKQHGMLANGEELPYAFGINVTNMRGLEAIAHTGSSAGYRAYAVYFPELDIGVVRQANRSDFASRIDREVVELFVGDRMEPAPEAMGSGRGGRRGNEPSWSPTSSELRAFEGRYFSPELEVVYTLVVEDGKLIGQHRRHDGFELRPREEDVFGQAGPLGTVRFERDASGRVTGMRVTNGRVRNLLFERMEG